MPIQVRKTINLTKNKEIFFSVIFLIILWLIACLIINPLGNFPLNDDWAYAKNVFFLSEQNILKFVDWPAMSLIIHTLYGTVFCKIFGFSFSILRISTIILSLIGIIYLYLLSKKNVKNNYIAIFTTLIIAFNPLYFSLSYTFMTDVPFLVWTIISFFYYFNYLTNNKIRYLLLASIFAIFAILIRQTGIFLPFAFFLIYLYKNKDKKSIFTVLISTILVISSLFLFQYYMKQNGKLPASYASASDLFNSFNVVSIIQKSFLRGKFTLLYSGLFLFPLTINYISIIWKNLSKQQKNIILILSFFVFLLSFITPFPKGNIFYNLGLGPKLLKDSYCNLNITPQLSKFVIIFLKIIGSLGAVFIVIFIIDLIFRSKKLKHKKYIFLILLILSAYFLYISLDSFCFDRYFLFMQIFFVFLFLKLPFKTTKKTKIISTSLLFIYITFSVFATHDYLSWNRVRWQILTELNTQGISPEEIDGGFEYNAWYQTNERGHIEKISEKSWWFVKNDNYVISFGKIEGFSIIKSVKYKTLIPTKNNKIFLLKKNKNCL